MKLDHHETDLYILPETVDEIKLIKEFLRQEDLGYVVSKSNVKGQKWYGKQFFEVAFMWCIRERLIEFVAEREIAKLKKTKTY